jgi:hypothetical protein
MVQWGPSEVTKAEIRRMEEDGLALEEVFVVGWRPPTVGQLAPAPSDQEIISFIDFHRLGLGLPLHHFVRGLLFFYGLHLLRG